MTAALRTRLAHATGRRQRETLAGADAAADLVGQTILRRWRQVLAVLTRKGVTPWEVRGEVAALVADLHADVAGPLAGRLWRLAAQGYDSAAAAMASALPVDRLRDVIEQPHRIVTEARTNQPPGLADLRLSPRQMLQVQGLARKLGLPVNRKLTAEQFRKLAKRLLFPPPTADQVRRILMQPIRGSTWHQDLAHATRLAKPDAWPQFLAAGIAAGQTPRETARAILPLVQGYKASATRIARTYGMQVAHHSAMVAHEQLGDLIIGYQVHSAHSPNSRSWHVSRDGTVYYLHPAPGQKGMSQCPHPPLEADDPAERPPGTPHTAWNCLCYLSPVLRPT